MDVCSWDWGAIGSFVGAGATLIGADSSLDTLSYSLLSGDSFGSTDPDSLYSIVDVLSIIIALSASSKKVLAVLKSISSARFSVAVKAKSIFEFLLDIVLTTSYYYFYINEIQLK